MNRNRQLNRGGLWNALSALLFTALLLSPLGGCGGGSAGTGTGDSSLRIQGVVKDNAGMPVNAATVTVIETGDFDITDAQGEFQIATEAVGETLTLEVSKENRSALTTITAPGENGTLTIEVKFDDVRQIVETEELSVNAKIVGACDRYFENFHTIRQANPVPAGTSCTTKVNVLAKGNPVPHVPIAVQFRSCTGKTWTTAALGATLSGANIGFAQIPFSFFDDTRHCVYRIITPFGEKSIRPVITEIQTLTFQNQSAK